MIENKAIFCRRFLSLSEGKYRRSSGICQRSSAPAGDHKFLPPLFVFIAHSSKQWGLGDVSINLSPGIPPIWGSGRNFDFCYPSSFKTQRLTRIKGVVVEDIPLVGA